MKTKTVVIFCALAFVTQIIQANGERDPRLQSCVEKFIEQVGKLSSNKLPSCYDVEKLKQGRSDIAVFEEFYSQLPSKCKKPNKENIVDCLKIIGQNINSKSDEMKAALVNSIHSFFAGGKHCIDNIKNVFTNLDKYVLNGCQEL
ncbi:uncharacterized protein LOC111692138 [Anoplophora glabripennis]|uniref:uncharacterized protein LOC111692138 n=1 Tax=Anoplophora glabripennis TaxID=217634 RepID=UPI000C76197F|nr:uncharacterized protein LOC111692138 [Anoplophora glabripennis]